MYYFLSLFSIFCILFSGCSSSVEIRYFSIGKIFSAPTSAKPAVLHSLVIENFQSSFSLKREEIILRDGKTRQISLSSHALWWGMPEEMVSEALRDYLSEQKVFEHVFSYPTFHRIPYYLEGTLKKFEIETFSSEWKACVALEVTLIEKESNKILWNSGLLESSVSSAPQLQDSVEKMGQALQEIFGKIAQEIPKHFPKKE
ncbi:MAG: membrane integrity-associated transporter subunit PqiC [Candidatus Brocadiae bacterium]|nr:membrane integrity-associated transporter subunit PqiC [Candidatus Brocadiia bacterium]